jgi:hypothetical protein
MTMWIIFGYVLPAVVFFVFGCLDEIDCDGELTIGGVIFGLGCAVFPIINWMCLISILIHWNTRYQLVKWNFVICRRKK